MKLTPVSVARQLGGDKRNPVESNPIIQLHILDQHSVLVLPEQSKMSFDYMSYLWCHGDPIQFINKHVVASPLHFTALAKMPVKIPFVAFLCAL